jgi:hypothetical protein
MLVKWKMCTLVYIYVIKVCMYVYIYVINGGLVENLCVSLYLCH